MCISSLSPHPPLPCLLLRRYDCTAQLVDFYAWMLQRIVDSGDPRHPLSVTLDRLTVQLFNTEDVTIRWDM